MCYSTRPSWDTSDLNTLPLALRHARYDGWPSPPIQLPRIASPSFKPAERHVTFEIDAPLNYRPCDGNTVHTQTHLPRLQYDTNPHPNSWPNIMRPVEYRHHNVYNSCVRNGSTHQNPSIRGAVETRTEAQHYKEDVAIKHNPVRRTKDSMPLINKDTQIANFISAPCVQLVYDLRYPLSTLRLSPSSPYAGRGFEFLRVPLRPGGHKQIRLISQDFPWAFDIGPELSTAQGVTCLDILTTLHTALQCPLSDTEWGAATEDKHASLIRARDRRLKMNSALRGSSNTRGYVTIRPIVPFVSDMDAQPARREPSILRVDWLGSRVAFGGLVKDEVFARRRLLPDAREPLETWVVKFQSLS